MTFNKIRKGILPLSISSALLLSASTAVFAATAGTPGETSTGTVDIQLVVPKLLRIRIFDDIDLGSYDGDANPRSAGAPACVQGNDDFDYTITATSASGTGAFRLTGTEAQTTQIAYQVEWAGADNEPVALTHGVAGEDFGVDETTLGPPCTQVGNKVVVTVPAWEDDNAEHSMGAALPGTYTDTLTLLVEPQ